MRIKISEKEKFILRVAGIFLKDQKVLLHRAEHEDFWCLPGGGCEFGEDSKTTLVREMIEEIGASVEVERLAFTVENYFDWAGQKVHEIGLYHLCEFKNESTSFYEIPEFFGIEDKMDEASKFKLQFKWFALADVPNLNVMPPFLKTHLATVTDGPKHIFERE